MSDPTEAVPEAAETSATASSQPAPNDLDSLLTEFDASTSGNPDARQPGSDTADPVARPDDAHDDTSEVASDEHGVLLGYARAMDDMARHFRTERDARDTRAAIGKIRGDVSEEIYPNSMVAGWITEQAKADPHVQAAWENRHKDSKGYEVAISRLGRAFFKAHGSLPDREATEDRAAVTAAVRGASASGPPQVSSREYNHRLERMSDNDFEKEKGRLMG